MNDSWLAGILEGEGCFHFNRCRGRSYVEPRVVIDMSDLDVVEKTAALMGSKVILSNGGTNKQMYRVQLTGIRAVRFMLRIVHLMGERRQSKIHEIVSEFYQNSLENPGRFNRVKNLEARSWAQGWVAA